jgi:hypothetical protein
MYCNSFFFAHFFQTMSTFIILFATHFYIRKWNYFHKWSCRQDLPLCGIQTCFLLLAINWLTIPFKRKSIIFCQKWSWRQEAACVELDFFAQCSKTLLCTFPSSVNLFLDHCACLTDLIVPPPDMSGKVTYY